MITRLLSNHAALIERRIDLLQQRLDSGQWLSARQRQAMLDKIKELEQERLATLAAAEVLNNSEALQNLLGGIIPTEEILKSIEVERKHLDKHRIKENFKEAGRLSDAEKRALENSINQVIVQLIEQLQQQQAAKKGHR